MKTKLIAKKFLRNKLEGFEGVSAKELRKMMKANDGLKAAKKLNDLTPAIELLYFLHEWRLDQQSTEG